MMSNQDRTPSTFYHIELGALSRCGAMKSIIMLYVNLLKDMEYYSLKQFKLRVTKEDMKAYGIRPEQHKLQHVRKALQYLENEGRKTPLRQKNSMTRASLDTYRQVMLADIDQRLSSLPESDPRICELQKTRERIEQSLTIP